MNDINEMPPVCGYCPYWEVCKPPYICPDIGDKEPKRTDKRTETHACDLTSRQAAIDAVAKILSDREGGNATWWKPVAESVINVLPSAQPERKRGQWIYNSPVTMKCDQCGLVIKDWDWHRFKFCPNCDCDMRGEENG